MDEEINKWMSSLLPLCQGYKDDIRLHLVKMCPKLKDAESM